MSSEERLDPELLLKRVTMDYEDEDVEFITSAGYPCKLKIIEELEDGERDEENMIVESIEGLADLSEKLKSLPEKCIVVLEVEDEKMTLRKCE